MVPESEIKAETHKSGHRLIDMIIAGSALFVSLCSLGLAIHSGRAMDRLVEANSRPVVVINHGDVDPDSPHNAPQPLLHYEIENVGAGSARIEWARLDVEGHPVGSWGEALKLVGDHAVARGALAATDNAALSFQNSDTAPAYLRPGDRRFVMTWARTVENTAHWNAIVGLRGSLHLKACYCSIFEQCWITDSKVAFPVSVPSCTAVRPRDAPASL
jgi:hypothetical protein